MPKGCTHANFLGTNSCNNPFNLGKVIFNDPHLEKSDVTWLCIEHSNHLIDKLFDSIKVLDKRIEWLEEKISSENKIPDYVMGDDEKLVRKHNLDNSGMMKRERENIAKLKKIKNDMMWNTCRHPLCGKHFKDDELIWSAVFFTPRGKMRKTIYLHHECWIKVKGMSGIMHPYQTGQFTIDMLT